MARKRVIDPEFWLDETMATLSAHARLLFIGTWNICDDNYATFPNKPAWLKIQIFPYEEVDILGLLGELSASGRIVPFRGKDGNDYFFIKNFFKWQRIDKPSNPKYEPYLAGLQEDSATSRSELSKVNEVNKVNKSEKLLKTSREKLKEKWGKK